MFLKCLGSIIPCAKHKKNRLNSLSEICGKQRMSQLNFLLCDFWIRRHDSANGRSENGQNDTVFSSLFYTNATEARAFLWTIPTVWLGTALPCWTVQLQSAGAAEMQPDLREEMHIGHQRCRTLCSLCITDNQGFIHVPQCSPVHVLKHSVLHFPLCTAACAVRFIFRGWKRFCSKTLYEQTFPPGIVIWFKLKSGPEFMMSCNYYSRYHSLN